ncbi:integrase core domain-containing protein [Polystyrenella longa]|uniref:integrase core domain-containing protein n=1 Tax=Polystyrenella longa TaxID=2528007 RepID=UPI00119E7BCA|nr:integrase core domain-containing protein [Polystyrenella longa]
MNAYLERFMRSLKSEYLNKIIFFGQHSLERALKEYVAHYHSERHHQGLDNPLIKPGDGVGCVAGKIKCRERLGGLLKYYYRCARKVIFASIPITILRSRNESRSRSFALQQHNRLESLGFNVG